MLFIVYYSDIISHGYFKNYNSLSNDELKILMENLECFYNYGKICNINHELELCECIIGKDFGSVII